MNDNNYQKRIEKRFELLKLAKCLYQDKEGLCNLKSNIRRLNPSCHEELERTDNSTDFFRVLEKYKIFTIDMTVKQIEELIEVLKIFGEEKHIREINKWKIVMVSHSTSKQILMFADRLKQIEKSFQDILHENLVIERGASSSSVMTISEFISSECKEYMERYFSGMDYFVFNDDDTFQLLKGFKTHLQKNKPAFLVRNYDLYNHFKFLQLHHLLTQSEMTVMDYMGFEAKNKFIYFIKLSNAKTLIELIRDVNTSATYLRMFALLHQNSLLSTGIHLVSVIVISDEFEKLKDEVSNNCQFCPKYIFTEKEFSKFSIGLFLKLKGNIKEDSICQTAFNFEDFKCAMGSLFCYMATKSGNLMPNLSNKCSTQIEQAIILYPQQVAVSNSSNKRVIIQGGSGSGKTIIGRLRLKELSSDPNNKVIYYINCGTSQGFTEEMKCFVDTAIQNSNVLCCSKSYFNTNSLTEMLQSIAREQENAETVHVILDEVPLDELNEIEILSFVEVLKNSKFKDGHFKIICQTMSKERSVLKDGVEVSRTNSNQIDLLQSKADFKLYILSKSVRNTVAIFKLVNIAIEMLEKESNSFTLDLFEVETVVKRQSASTKDDKSKKQSEMTSGKNTITSDHRSELLDDDESAKSVNGDVSTKKRNTDISKIPANLDANLKYLDKPKRQNAIRNDVLESIFNFKKNDGTSHKIEGPTPVLFFPFADEHYNEKDKICLLTACFHETFVENYIPLEEHVTIIHFENKPPSLLVSSLKCLEEIEIFPNYVFKGSLDVHGLEFDNVIIYINVGEYHMRHYLVEAMTRCKSNLVIIAVKEDIKNVHENVFLDILKRYETEKLVTVVKFGNLEDVLKDIQDSYKDYIYESSQENQITESGIMSRTVEQFVASLKPLQQFQHDNKEDTRALEPNNEALDKTTKVAVEENIHALSVIHEIANRISEWKIFGRILGLEESFLNQLQRDCRAGSERNHRIIEKFSIPLKPNPSWTFWRQYLDQFEDGKLVIEEIEGTFLDLLPEIPNTDVRVRQQIAGQSPMLQNIGNPLFMPPGGSSTAAKLRDHLLKKREMERMQMERMQMEIQQQQMQQKTPFVSHNKPTRNQCPTISHDDGILYELSKSCGAKWEFIGIFIGLDYSDVERLSANNQNSEDKLLEIFKEKIGTEEGLTWPMIHRALSYLKFNRHIKNIEDNPSYKHLTSGSYELPRPNWLFFMAYVSFRISSFWEKLGRQLKVQEIDAIKSDNVRYRGIESKAFAVLRAKYDSEDGLNWTMLANALKDCGRSDVIRNIKEIQEFKHLF